jgi:hypothetical protein
MPFRLKLAIGEAHDKRPVTQLLSDLKWARCCLLTGDIMRSGCATSGDSVLQRSLDHGGNLIVVDAARAARAGFVKQGITAILQKSATPLANGVFVEAEFDSHRLTWQSIRTSQDREAPLR